MNPENYYKTILGHYINCWNNEPKTYLLDKGPTQHLPYDFRVLEFPPSDKRDMWTYATICMSQVGDLDPIEVFMFSSIKDENIIELLTAIVYFHRNTSFLKLNETINFGRGWQDNSECWYAFLSLPYLDGPRLEVLEDRDLDKSINFYWAVPITKDEAVFKSKHGIDALEEELEINSFNYLDPHRKGVV